jgi:hypothetical protein
MSSHPAHHRNVNLKTLIAIECELGRQREVTRSIKALDILNPSSVTISGMIDLVALAAAIDLPDGQWLPPFYKSGERK